MIAVRTPEPPAGPPGKPCRFNRQYSRLYRLQNLERVRSLLNKLQSVS